MFRSFWEWGRHVWLFNQKVIPSMWNGNTSWGELWNEWSQFHRGMQDFICLKKMGVIYGAGSTLNGWFGALFFCYTWGVLTKQPNVKGVRYHHVCISLSHILVPWNTYISGIIMREKVYPLSYRKHRKTHSSCLLGYLLIESYRRCPLFGAQIIQNQIPRFPYWNLPCSTLLHFPRLNFHPSVNLT